MKLSILCALCRTVLLNPDDEYLGRGECLGFGCKPRCLTGGGHRVWCPMRWDLVLCGRDGSCDAWELEKQQHWCPNSRHTEGVQRGGVAVCLAESPSRSLGAVLRQWRGNPEGNATFSVSFFRIQYYMFYMLTQVLARGCGALLGHGSSTFIIWHKALCPISGLKSCLSQKKNLQHL